MEKSLDYTESLSESFQRLSPGSSLSKTQEETGKPGCPSCGAICTDSGIPACQFACPPLNLGSPIIVTGSSLWPTPTAKANHFAPYMRRWPAYSRLQDDLGCQGGTPSPNLFEWLMGFPKNWTELGLSGTRFRRKSRKRSG